MTTINKLDYPYEVKVEFVDTDDLNTITPKNEGEITIDAELLHKESFVAITNYEDLIVEAPRLCSICDGIFPNSYSFLQHNLHHLKLKLDKCDEYSCKTCSGKFSTHHDLENHIRNCILYDNNKSICPICKEHIESTKLRSHLRTHPNKEAKCDICGVIIKSLSNFRHHMQNIHNRQFKNCEYCGKSIRLFYYSVHIKKVHGHEKVKCDLCCKYFNSVENMERHKLYIHEKLKTKQTQDLKYKCLMCSHAFKLERNLIAHVEKCKPLKCGLCDSIFKNKPNLRNHLTWVHYSGNGHSCEICGKTFKSPYSVRKHMKTSHSADKQER